MIVSGSMKMESQETKKALFLDRDGVINIDHGYVYETDRLEFLEDLGPILKKLSEKFLLIVITNQSGIARSLFKYSDVESFHKFLNKKLLEDYGCEIDAFYVCPHHPKFSGACSCRKPGTAMLAEAVKDFNIKIEESIFVGDKASDIECAKNFSIPTTIQIMGQYEKSKNADYYVSSWKQIEKLLLNLKLI